MRGIFYWLMQQIWQFVYDISAPRVLTNEVKLSQTDAATGPRIITGTGTPEAVVTAPVGSVYLNLSGGAATTLYVKTSGVGNTGWTAK